jgi:hypothetical protein
MPSLIRRMMMLSVAGIVVALMGCGASKADTTGTGGDATTSSSSDDDECGKPPKAVTPPPHHACSAGDDARVACPLPKSITEASGDGTTVYYFTHPTCVDSSCHYCVTSTYTEDPNATAAP